MEIVAKTGGAGRRELVVVVRHLLFGGGCGENMNCLGLEMIVRSERRREKGGQGVIWVWVGGGASTAGGLRAGDGGRSRMYVGGRG